VTTNGGALVSGAPWLFGVGEDSLFYSPFWQVYGFEPDGGGGRPVTDARAVLPLVARTGRGAIERRTVVEAPAGVTVTNLGATTGIYAADTAIWDGEPMHRYIDFGTGKFAVGADGVVVETPLFRFVDAAERLVDDARFVGGTRPFGAAGVASNPAAVSDAGASLPPAPGFGALWRLYLVVLADDSQRTVVDGRVTYAAVPLDSQAAIEATVPGSIRRTDVLFDGPLVELAGQPVVITPNP
jgi:hypothetical protein